MRGLLLATFATTYSRALQETLYAMGRAVLEAHEGIEEISFAAPNKHHFLVDLAPFGLDNPGEVFIAADRPYGLIEATVLREPAPGFNEMADDVARDRLLTCLDVPRWADEVLAGRPYTDINQVEARMAAVARTITDDELERALARHPRIGERADEARHDAGHSTREQAGVDRQDADVARRLAEGNRAYEERFDRVFIIRAAGRDAEEILRQLRRRLDNTDEAERVETIDQLTQIAQLRMRDVWG